MTEQLLGGGHAPLVRNLLRHFEAVGFEGAPRVLGIDDAGRDVVSWVEGEAGSIPVPPDDDVLADIGRLMRRMHDAQDGFDSGAEVVCHNDWWPGNLIFRDGRVVALIDWELAAPGTRLQDLARAAAWWAPLRPDNAARERGLDPARRGERLRVLCDAYGLAAAGRARILDVAIAEQLSWAEDPPDEDSARLMRLNAAWIEENRAELERWP